MTARRAPQTSGRPSVAFGRPGNRIWSLLVTIAVAGGLVWFDPGVVRAAAGDLDPSLGGTGTVATNYQELDVESFRVMDTATDALGRTLLAGLTGGGETPDMVVARVLDTGDLDSSFSDDGVAFVDIGEAVDFASAVAVAPGGDIVLAGTSIGSTNAIGVARLNADGTFDGTFGDAGRLQVPFPDPTTEVGDVIFDAAGRIVIGAGNNATGDALWVGLVGTTGALDPTFSGDGIMVQDLGGSGERAFGLAALPGGGFVSVNQSQSFNGTKVTRHAADGSLEPTFGTAGVASVSQFVSQAAPTLLADGSMLLSVNGGGKAGVARLSTTSGALVAGFGTAGVASKTDVNVVAAGSPVKLADTRIVVGATELNQPAVIMFSDLGALDTSFGGDGVATTATAAPAGFWQTDSVSSTAAGILVTGTRPKPSGFEAVSLGRAFLAEVDLSGAPVTAYGTGGIATPVITNTFYSREVGYDVAITPGGKLAMVGEFAEPGMLNEFAVLVVNADGTPDTSFATGGVFTDDFGAVGAGAQAIAAQPDGKLVIAGRAGSDALIARMTEDGQLDPTFGAGAGYVIVDVCACAGDEFMDVVVGDDGTIAVAIDTVNPDTNSPDLAAARFTPAGDLDVTFSDDGISFSPGPGTFAHSTGVAVDSQGRVLVGGYDNNAVFARFTPDGSLDATFGAGTGDAGEISAPFPGADWSLVTGIIVNADDSLVGFGSGTFGSDDDAVLVEVDATGAFDASFGDGGLARVTTPEADFFEGLDVDSTGRLIAAGGFGADFAVARFTAGGVLEGSDTVEFPGGRDFAMGVAVDTFDRAVAVGSSSFRNGDISIARLVGDTPISSSSQATDAGETAQLGTTPSPSDPLVTAVTPSAGGVVTIVEGDTTATAPDGFEFLGRQIEITAPPGTETEPIQIVFGIDNGTLEDAGVTIDDVAVARNGVVLVDCTTTSPLSPTPACVADRTPGPEFGTITVLSTETSVFNLLTAAAGDNQPPVATTGDPAAFNEDTTVQIGLTGEDPDDDPLTFVVTAVPAHGTLYDGTTTAAHAITAGEAAAGYTLAGDTVAYRPAANYHGPDAFIYKVNDGQADSPADTVDLVVTPVDDATTTTYTGASKGFVAKKNAKLMLSARLTSSDSACVAGRAVTFSFDKNPTTGTAPSFDVGPVISAANGVAKLSVSTEPWVPGTYQVTVTTSARVGCLGSSSSPATLILQTQKSKGP